MSCVQSICSRSGGSCEGLPAATSDHVRVKRKEVRGPGQGQCRRLRASDEQAAGAKTTSEAAQFFMSTGQHEGT